MKLIVSPRASRSLAEIPSHSRLNSHRTAPGTLSKYAWKLHRSDLFILRPGEFLYGLSYPEESHRLIPEGHFDNLLEWAPAGKPIVVFMERRHYHKILASAGPPELEIMGEMIVIALYRGR